MARYSGQLFRHIFTTIIIVVFYCPAILCQDTNNAYRLVIEHVDKDSLFTTANLGLQTQFSTQPLCMDYVNKLPALLQLKGYLSASVDEARYDSSTASIRLYTGHQYSWLRVNMDSVDKKALDESGFVAADFINRKVNFTQLELLKDRLLNYYEKNGYPFATVWLDSIKIYQQLIDATLKIQSGPLYHVDSIRVQGKAKISNRFLQHYLAIPNGSIYNKEKLQLVDKKLLNLPYVQAEQPAELLMLGTGSVLNLYLQPKRSSQVNFLVGFLPANNQTGKLQLTGDVNLHLKNSLGNGETILVNWQQLQLSSPRLTLGYQHPYIFNSSFGVDFLFELFKKDSSFLQLNAQLGIQYLFSANQSGRIFFQQQATTLLGAGADTNLVKLSKKLPVNIDVSAVSAGIDYEWNNTNYRLNPRRGNEVKLVASAGIKTIKKNNDIISITDPNFDYNSLYDSLKLKTYQLRLKLSAAHYFAAGKRSTVKAVLNSGLFSSESVFRNELFQIGGFKLLRGFDEESIYATRYAVATVEYRYLVGLNSYLFCFTDAGWVKNKFQEVDVNSNYQSAGLGMLFETKAGLINISFAVGKRSDTNFDLRRASKIHFGYINYF
jgi:outer membrane protein assembly factor BamA